MRNQRAGAVFGFLLVCVVWGWNGSFGQDPNTPGVADPNMGWGKLIEATLGAMARPPLSKLPCVRLLVEKVSDAAKRHSITEEGLESTLLVGLKAKLPRLKVGTDGDRSDCPSVIYLNLSLMDTHVGGRARGFAASVRLEAVRRVTVEENGAMTSAAVWNDQTLLTGPPEGVKAMVSEALDELVTKFAAAYYEAGNP